VEVYTAHWTVVLIEPIDQRAHAIVPELEQWEKEPDLSLWFAGKVRTGTDPCFL
jgi:hypothetical protein